MKISAIKKCVAAIFSSAVIISMATPVSATWVQGDHSSWMYQQDDGQYFTNGWKQIESKWYLFDSSGVMLTGWQKVNDKWYYLYPSGAMATGWINDNGHWYFLDNSGAMKTGWIKSGDNWYYTDSTGAMVTGECFINNQLNSFSASGVWQYAEKEYIAITEWIPYNTNDFKLLLANIAKGNVIVDKNGKYWASPEYATMLMNEKVEYFHDISEGDSSTKPSTSSRFDLANNIDNIVNSSTSDDIDLDGIS